MRRFEFHLLIAIACLPAAVKAQQPIAPPSQSPVAAEATLESEDMVPAAELDEALRELEAVHAQNYQTLAGLAKEVPEAARPAIQRAMENSQRGWQRARDNRQRAQAKRQAKRQAKMQKEKGGRPSWAGQGGRQGYRPTQMKGSGGRPEQIGQADSRRSFGQGQSGSSRFGQQPRTANSFQQQSRESFQQFRGQGGSQQQRGQSGTRGKSRR